MLAGGVACVGGNKFLRASMAEKQKKLKGSWDNIITSLALVDSFLGCSFMEVFGISLSVRRSSGRREQSNRIVLLG